MSHNVDDTQQKPMSRRSFLDVMSKSIIATAAVCLIPMSQVAALADRGSWAENSINPYQPYNPPPPNPNTPNGSWGYPPNPQNQKH